MTPLEQGPIRVRTTGERNAYISGYSQALLDVYDHGFEKAQEFLRLIVDTEKEIEE